MLFFKSTEWFMAEVRKKLPEAVLTHWEGNCYVYYWVKPVFHNWNFDVRSPRKAWIKAYKYVRYL